jgi:hypothetical protein
MSIGWRKLPGALMMELQDAAQKVTQSRTPERLRKFASSRAVARVRSKGENATMIDDDLKAPKPQLSPEERKRLDQLLATHRVMDQLDALVDEHHKREERLYAPASPAMKPESASPTPEIRPLIKYKSDWKKALWESIVANGPQVGYADAANWLAENCPNIRPPYLAADEDLVFKVRHDGRARQLFENDLSKVRGDFLQSHPA